MVWHQSQVRRVGWSHARHLADFLRFSAFVACRPDDVELDLTGYVEYSGRTKKLIPFIW